MAASEKLQRLFADLDEAPELGIPAEELVAVVRAAEQTAAQGDPFPSYQHKLTAALAALDEKLADAG